VGQNDRCGARICLQALQDSAWSRIVNSEAFNNLTLNCQNLSFKVKIN
jgi:hypothetical protein